MIPQQMTNDREGDWASSIEEAISAVDPLISNFQITRCHYLLSEALRAAIGGEPGANFHSWAVWGSRKAGVTIRQEDRDQASRDATIVAGIVGGLVGALVGYLMATWMGLSIAFSMLLWIAIGIVTGGFCGFKLAGYTRTAAARLVLEGNRLVLDDIGRVTARFLQYTNESPDGHDVAAYELFQSDLLQSEATHGDRELLLRAFEQYEASRLAIDDAVRHEASYFANCLAILHEHIRLQPYISKSLPFLISKCVTQRLMTFNVGEETLAVHEDVPPLNKALFPPTLEKLANE